MKRALLLLALVACGQPKYGFVSGGNGFVPPTGGQAIVTGTCTAPNAVRAIAADGTVTCTTGVVDTAGSGLTKVGSTLSSTVGMTFFGFGTDGTVTFDGTTTVLGIIPSSNTYTLTRSIQCHNCTCNSGVEIKLAGYLFIDDATLTVPSGTCHIDDDGTSASAGSLGAARAGGWFIANAAGKNGGITGSGTGVAGADDTANAFCVPFVASATAAAAGVNGTGGTNGTPLSCNGGGGGGGTASTGGTGGVYTVTAVTACGPDPFQSLVRGRVNQAFTTQLQGGSSGGSGGGGTGAAGGGSGAAGGNAVVGAYKIAGAGTLLVSANGGNGATPASSTGGGGGGGGGGLAMLFYMTNSGATLTVQANGGTGANGLGGGGKGGNGGSCFAQPFNLSHDGT